MLKKIHDPAVDWINFICDTEFDKIKFVIFFKNPPLCITPPNIIAEITNNTIHIMPNTPLLESRLDTDGCSIGMLVPKKIVFKIVINVFDSLYRFISRIKSC